jgi:rfaE bifunctional protein nucleotidyltransferase chain/domain
MVIVWTNGCFDILHRGHFEMLEYAKSLGDYLVVGIDSDQKVKNDKGWNRPYNSEKDRKFALECLQSVDKVVIFNTPNELSGLIEAMTPDIMVIGSDWRGKKVVGEAHTKELKFFDRIGDYSTTNILKGIR